MKLICIYPKLLDIKYTYTEICKVMRTGQKILHQYVWFTLYILNYISQTFGLYTLRNDNDDDGDSIYRVTYLFGARYNNVQKQHFGRLWAPYTYTYLHKYIRINLSAHHTHTLHMIHTIKKCCKTTTTCARYNAGQLLV